MSANKQVKCRGAWLAPEATSLSGPVLSQIPPPPNDVPPASGVLGSVLSLTLLVGTTNGMSRVALPMFGVALGSAPWQLGIVSGVGYAGFLILALPIGAWIERQGTRRPFLWGTVPASVLFLGLSAASLPWHLVAFGTVLGLAAPLRTMPANAEFLAILPTLSPARAGWNRAAHMSGLFLLGPAAAAAVISTAGYAPAFVLMTLAMLSSAAVANRVLTVRAPSAQSNTGMIARIRLQLALFRESSRLRQTMLVDLLTQGAVAYFTVFGLAMGMQQLRMPAQAAAGLITLQGMLYVLTVTVAGGPLARLAPWHGYRGVFVLLALQCGLFAWAPGQGALWLGAALLGVAGGIQGLLNVTSYAELAARHGRGRITGITALAPTAGGVIGAIGGGFVTQSFGTTVGFVALSALFVVALAMSWLRRASDDGRSGV